MAGEPVTDDPRWGETHAFDDMPLFATALQGYLYDTLNGLNMEQTNAMHGRIYALARAEVGAETVDFSDPQWGEVHAQDNVLRLIDALTQTE